jgi:hypothetical protein
MESYQELPKLNSNIYFWHTSFGYDISGAPKWKVGKYINFEDENIFVEKQSKKHPTVIVADVNNWKYI